MDDRRDDVDLRGMTDRPSRHDEVEEDRTDIRVIEQFGPPPNFGPGFDPNPF